MKTGIFYGSSSGKTKAIATDIAAMLSLQSCLHDIAESSQELFHSYDLYILGTSTWDIGELQPDWKVFAKNLEAGSMAGKSCILFGLGDQGAYPDSFADGLGLLAGILRRAGGRILLPWENKDYCFAQSLALENGMFCGLVLDENCQPDMTQARLQQWIGNVEMERKKEQDAFTH